jgi:hypothetical protein
MHPLRQIAQRGLVAFNTLIALLGATRCTAPALLAQSFSIEGYTHNSLLVYQIQESPLIPTVDKHTFVTDVFEAVGRIKVIPGSLASFYSETSLRYDIGSQAFQPHLYQGYIECHPFDDFLCIIGKQRVKWGVGLYWIPTDNIKSRKPLYYTEGALEGDLAFLFQYVTSETAVSLVVEPDTNEYDYTRGVMTSPTLEHTQIAGQLYSLVGDVEVFLSGSYRYEHGSEIGIAFSKDLFSTISYVEAAWKTHWLKNFYLSDSSYEHHTKPLFSSANLRPSFVVGCMRQWDDQTVIGEYFHNELGYSTREAANYLAFIARKRKEMELLPQLAAQTQNQLRDAASQYEFAQYTRNYIFLSYNYFKESVLSCSMASVWNLDDRSLMAIGTFNFLKIDNMALTLQLSVPYGKRGTEFSLMPQKWSMLFRTSLYY